MTKIRDDKPIDERRLSAEARRLLNHYGLATVGDIRSKDNGHLLSLGFDKKSIVEIRQACGDPPGLDVAGMKSIRVLLDLAAYYRLLAVAYEDGTSPAEAAARLITAGVNRSGTGAKGKSR